MRYYFIKTAVVDSIRRRFIRLQPKPQLQNEADAERQLAKKYLIQDHNNKIEQQKIFPHN